MLFYDDLRCFMSMEQRNGNCHKMLQILSRFAQRQRLAVHSSKHLATHAAHSLQPLGECGKLGVCLPDRPGRFSEHTPPGPAKQRTRDRAPQLRAGDPFGVREGHSLSDKEL